MSKPFAHRIVRTSWLALGVALIVAVATAAPDEPADPPVDVRGLPVPAWQEDPELLGVWQHLTGRYIFARACQECHAWGPAHLDRSAWAAWLAGFPGNHEPDVRAAYEDLTARFAPGRMVPGAEEQLDALATFLLAEGAPSRDATSDAPWAGLPQIGAPAPAFRFTDLAGRTHTLDDYVGERPLVLVMSRAYW